MEKNPLHCLKPFDLSNLTFASIKGNIALFTFWIFSFYIHINTHNWCVLLDPPVQPTLCPMVPLKKEESSLLGQGSVQLRWNFAASWFFFYTIILQVKTQKTVLDVSEFHCSASDDDNDKRQIIKFNRACLETDHSNDDNTFCCDHDHRQCHISFFSQTLRPKTPLL